MHSGCSARRRRRSAAAPIAQMVRQLVDAGAIATPPADDEPRGSGEAEAVRRGLIALTALRSYDGLATAVLDAQARPRSSWWPIAAALSRVGDDRAVPALIELVSSPSPYTAGYAVRGLGERKAVGGAADAAAAARRRATGPPAGACRPPSGPPGSFATPRATAPLLALLRPEGRAAGPRTRDHRARSRRSARARPSRI